MAPSSVCLLSSTLAPKWAVSTSLLNIVPKYHIYVFHITIPPQKVQTAYEVMSCSAQLLTPRNVLYSTIYSNFVLFTAHYTI